MSNNLKWNTINGCSWCLISGYERGYLIDLVQPFNDGCFSLANTNTQGGKTIVRAFL